MNRRAFAARLSEQTGHPASTLETLLETVVDILGSELAKSGRFGWRGLGTFTVRAYAPRSIHNPATGETIPLAARRTVTFKPSAQLRSKVEVAGVRARGTSRPRRRPSRSGGSSSRGGSTR